MAAVISSGWVSHSRVEPSTSPNSNVTVPVGNSTLTRPLAPVRPRYLRRWIDLTHASQHPVPLTVNMPENADVTTCWPDVSPSVVTGCFLDELHAGGQAQLGVDVGEVGLHRPG